MWVRKVNSEFNIWTNELYSYLYTLNFTYNSPRLFLPLCITTVQSFSLMSFVNKCLKLSILILPSSFGSGIINPIKLFSLSFIIFQTCFIIVFYMKYFFLQHILLTYQINHFYSYKHFTILYNNHIKLIFGCLIEP